MNEAYIVAATRTAGGRRGGRLSGWHPADLSGQVLNELLDRVDADPAMVDDVIMGCVSQIGEQAMNVARNAVLASRLPESVPGTSVDRQCGSSQQALHFAAQAVMSGTQDMVIAAGVESMSRVPMGAAIAMPACSIGKSCRSRYATWTATARCIRSTKASASTRRWKVFRVSSCCRKAGGSPPPHRHVAQDQSA